jgi:ABC-type branched-subunit amino acid transport system substrate-binding protein
VFIPDAPKTAGLLIPQPAYFDISKPLLMGTNLWHSEELVAMSCNYVQGAVFPDGFFADSRRPMVSRFVEAYSSVYGDRPGFMEAVAYDTASLVLQSLSQQGVRSKTQIRDALLKLADYPGATGLTAFDYDGDARKQPFMISIHRDKLVELPTAAATTQPSPVLTP